MKRLWALFTSLELTIVLAILVCLAAAYGSILTMGNSAFYRGLDSAILLPTLLKGGTENLKLTLWIFVLIILVAIFSVNTALCTLDKLIQIARRELGIKSLLPHIVHIGFLIAVLGHLLGSVYGFKNPYNFLVKGEQVSVPGAEEVSVRLERVKIDRTEEGEISNLKTTVTIIEDGEEQVTGDIEINGPLLYKGIGFYHANQGEIPVGLELSVGGGGGVQHSVRFGDSFIFNEAEYRLGELYPDFIMGSDGVAYSRSAKFANPVQEIVTPDGQSAYLPLRGPGSSANLSGKGGTRIVLTDFILAPYAVLIINKDPGIWLIVIGSIILTLGVVLIFIFRGGKAELVKQVSGGGEAAADA
ncbi:MAG: cytochrome c biogenesis protein ResB [Thermodesulfobacteriota bacterium]